MTAEYPLRFGVQFGGARDAAEWTAGARRAEELGYSAFLVPDHIFPRSYAPWAALAAAAAATSRIRIGTLLLNNDFRHPVMVAREALTLHLISGGRVDLGLGAGWNRPEYDEAGLPFDPPAVRVSRLEESVQIVRELLAGRAVDFHGEHYRVRQHKIEVGSPAGGAPPRLVVGGNGNRVLHLAAAHADVVSLLGVTVLPDGSRDHRSFTVAGLQRKLDIIAAAARSRAVPPEISAYLWAVVPGRSAREAAQAHRQDPSLSVDDLLRSPFALFGTPAEMAAKILALRERSAISYWVVNATAMEDMAPVLAELGAEGASDMRGAPR